MINRPSYFQPGWINLSKEVISVDICVYGGTAGGVACAVTAARRGKSAVILQPGLILGGMTTGGLGFTDFGKQHVIGGMARQFYRDLGKHYNQPEVWLFEPHGAQRIIDRYVRDANVPVRYAQYLDRVEIVNGRIASIRLLGGLVVRAKMFVDATYEGDLLAKAGCSFHVGREANSVYGETINGVQVRKHHQFAGGDVDPYVVAGDPSSGTLPQVNMQDAAPDGSGDGRLQAYNFRVCMCDDPGNRIPWEKPEGFDPRQYVLATRWFNTTHDRYNELLRDDGELGKFDRLVVRSKTDTNNHGPISSDFIGANYAWPEADYAVREQIFQAHVTYQKGFYWFMANDPSIPERYRAAIGRWGLAKDEFESTGHWPHQIYVREARRLVADYVVTENDTQHRSKATDPVGMGSYNMDSHNCQRFIRDGKVMNEGDVQLPPAGPYGISYRAIVPKAGQCQNLLVPVCVSSSHIAYGSIRMEPVFMILGESAAIAASLAIDANTSVQNVPYAKLRPELDKAGQVLQV